MSQFHDFLYVCLHFFEIYSYHDFWVPAVCQEALVTQIVKVIVYGITQWGSNSTFDQKVENFDLLKICKFSKNTPLWSICFLDDLSILIRNDFMAI